MLQNAGLESAQAQIIKHTRLLNAENIPLMATLGRVSAVDLLADNDLPSCAQSAVDGFALADEGELGRDRYRIAGRLSLGDVPSVPLQPGQAVGILTGGNLPSGTRAVIPHEKVEKQDNIILAREVVKPGNNIKAAGEDYKEGDQLLTRGAVLTPGQISLLAAYGVVAIPVVRKPRVAVLCLSRHVVPWQVNPQPGQIRDSNGPLLTTLVRQDGGLPVAIETAPSNRAALEKAASLLELADILIMTGGTYAESGYEARQVMEELGSELIYWDIPIQPGSHTGAGSCDSRLLFALSGNPGACAVGYHLFVAPAVRALQGLSSVGQHQKAICINGFDKKSGSRRFIRAKASWDQEGWQVAVLPGQKPSMIRSLVDCNALIDVPAGSPPIEPGQEVSILLLGIQC